MDFVAKVEYRRLTNALDRPQEELNRITWGNGGSPLFREFVHWNEPQREA